ncbi:unnamed protein product [Mytilus edulis]|uniref:Chitin-binding type-2 domain-containing protein n=1 Tax=Mytilus edulis TaxID=6550 RepID=A0A8S3TPQ9_MYTED|nr:unnamed protein product [Mytilus edulis]
MATIVKVVKGKDQEHDDTDSTQCNMSSDNGYNETIDSPGSCLIGPCENGGTCVNYTCVCEDCFAGVKCEIDVNQTCKYDADTFIPHSNTCQLFYNCSQAVSPLPTENRVYSHNPQILRPAYLHECPYPELFSTTTLSCDYLAVGYFCNHGTACKICEYFNPDCMGISDGIYRNVYVEPPGGHYFECQDERSIFDGGNPCPTNMAPYNGKCRNLFEIPTTYWHVGYGVDCSGRPNGNYESERKHRCDIYYIYMNGNSTLQHCGEGTVFDSKSLFCQNPANACRPCGSVDNGC